MLNDAIAKLKTEMEQNNTNSYIQVVGGVLLQHLEANPGSAEQILAQDKTIKKSLEEMKKEAKKHQCDGCAMLTDAEGCAVVLKYFGIKPAARVQTPAPAPALAPAAPVPENKSTGFNVRLEDLL